MEYVKIINPGDTYTSIAKTQEEMAKFGCNNVVEEVPIRGNYYLVIAKTPHPNSPGTELTSIQDGGGRQFIVGPNAWTPIETATTSSYGSTDYYYGPDEDEMPKAVKAKPTPRPVVDKYHGLSLGDTVIVVDRKHSLCGEKYDVTDLEYKGYEVVVGDIGTRQKSNGFKFSQIAKFIPEPELLPDDKPQFSKNEILEILNQDKTKDEIILDLMDHITN